MMTKTNHDTPDHEITAEDLMDTLEVTKIRRRDPSGGTWAKGTIGGHRFEALVFAEHAESEGYELEDSRISKLWVQRIADKATVACFDRGWDTRPTTVIGTTIVGLLAMGLADFVYED